MLTYWSHHRCYSVWWDYLMEELGITAEREAIDCKSDCDNCIFAGKNWRV